MSPYALVTGQVCGLCGRKIDPNNDDHDVHWKTHPLRDRITYWMRSPWIRVDGFSLHVDGTGIVLLDHNQKRFKQRGNQLVWSWIWK
jgi:hypothetical protein